jgi:hypothetical protein
VVCFIEFGVLLLAITQNFVALTNVCSINIYMMVFLKDDLTLIVIDLLSLGRVEV